MDRLKSLDVRWFTATTALLVCLASATSPATDGTQAKEDLRLEAVFQEFDGTPWPLGRGPSGDGEATLWRAVGDDEPQATDWKDPVTGRTWRIWASMRNETQGLPSGTYRVAFDAAPRKDGPGGRGRYVSQPFRLTGMQPVSRLTVRRVKPGRVVVRIVDADTGEALPQSVVRLAGPPGFPPTWDFPAEPLRPGKPVAFIGLPPGEYIVSAVNPPPGPASIGGRVEGEPITVVVEPGKEVEATLRVRGVPRIAEERNRPRPHPDGGRDSYGLPVYQPFANFAIASEWELTILMYSLLVADLVDGLMGPYDEMLTDFLTVLFAFLIGDRPPGDGPSDPPNAE